MLTENSQLDQLTTKIIPQRDIDIVIQFPALLPELAGAQVISPTAGQVAHGLALTSWHYLIEGKQPHKLTPALTALTVENFEPGVAMVERLHAAAPLQAALYGSGTVQADIMMPAEVVTAYLTRRDDLMPFYHRAHQALILNQPRGIKPSYVWGFWHSMLEAHAAWLRQKYGEVEKGNAAEPQLAAREAYAKSVRAAADAGVPIARIARGFKVSRPWVYAQIED